MLERTVYQCEHCQVYRREPRIFFSKTNAEKHERGCFYNLENKTCFTCKHNTRRVKRECENVCELDKDKGDAYLPVSIQIAFKCEFWEER